MPSTIDSLTLELDLGGQAKFSQQIDALNQNISKLRDQMGATAKEVESTDSKLANSFSRLKAQALGLLAVVMGGKGIKEYIGYLTTMDAATSRLSRTLGISTTELSAWQNVARLTGGTAEGMTGSIQGITSEMNRFMLTGQSAITGLLRPLGISIFNDAQQLKSATDLMVEIADALDKRKDMTAARKAEYLRMLGFDQSTINLMLRGKDVMVAMIREQKELSNVTGQSAANAEKLATAWNRMLITAENLGRAILNKLSPAFTKFLEVLSYGFQYLSGGPIPQSMKDRMDAINREHKEMDKRNEEKRKQYDIDHPPRDFSWMYPQRPGTGTRGDRNNNPGNMEYGPFAIAHGATGTDGRFAIFPNKATGDAAMGALLRKNYQGLTVEQIQRKWVSGNTAAATDPAYLSRMTKATGLQPSSVPDLNNQIILDRLMTGMTQGEGTSRGSVPLVPAGAAAAAVVNNRGGDSRSSTSTSQTTIGTMNVTLPNVGDAAGFAKDVKPQMERASFGAQADAGLE